MRNTAILLTLLMLTSVLAGCAGDSSAKDEKIASLEAEIANLTAEAEDDIEALQSVLSQAQMELSNATTQVNTLTEEVTALEELRANLSESLSTVMNQLNQTEDDELIAQLESQVADLNADIAEAGATIDSLNSDIAEKQTQIDELDATVSALESTVNSITYNIRDRISSCPESNPGLEMVVGYDDGSGTGLADDGELNDEEVHYRVGECPGDHARVGSFQNNSDGYGPGSLTNMGGVLYFAADDGIHGWELWRSDGSVAGTYMIKDLRDEHCEEDGSGELQCTNSGGLIVHCWQWDSRSCYYPEMVAGNEKIFFTGFNGEPGTESGVVLFVSDGTAAGTQPVLQHWTEWDPQFVSEEGWDWYNGPANLIPIPSSGFLSDRVVYTALDVHGEINQAPSGEELWISDGTESGTFMLANIQPEDESAINPSNGQTYCCGDFQGGKPQHLLKKGNTIWFSANSLDYGRELYRYGLQAIGGGLFLVEDLVEGEEGSEPMWMTSGSDGVYFSAQEESTGRELYHSRGDAFSTGIVKDINSGNNSSDPMFFTKFGDKVMFTAYNEENGRELWISDRTEAGTYMVKDINTNGSSDPYQLHMLDGILYFTAYEEDHGRELWRSDGTAAGTYMVKDLNPGTNDSWHFAQNFVSGPIFIVHQGELFYACNDGVHGVEICRSDGTAEGTMLAVDINVGENSSWPLQLTSVGPKLYTNAFTEEFGRELHYFWDNPGPIISEAEGS